MGPSVKECNSGPPIKFEDAPQSPEETVEVVTSVPRERVQQRTAEKLAKDRRLQRTVEQAFVD